MNEALFVSYKPRSVGRGVHIDRRFGENDEKIVVNQEMTTKKGIAT